MLVSRLTRQMVFSVQAQSTYFSNKSKLSAFLQKISNNVHLFLRQYPCLATLVLAVTDGLEKCGKQTIYKSSMPMSLVLRLESYFILQRIKFLHSLSCLLQIKGKITCLIIIIHSKA